MGELHKQKELLEKEGTDVDMESKQKEQDKRDSGQTTESSQTADQGSVNRGLDTGIQAETSKEEDSASKKELRTVESSNAENDPANKHQDEADKSENAGSAERSIADDKDQEESNKDKSTATPENTIDDDKDQDPDAGAKREPVEDKDAEEKDSGSGNKELNTEPSGSDTAGKETDRESGVKEKDEAPEASGEEDSTLSEVTEEKQASEETENTSSDDKDKKEDVTVESPEEKSASSGTVEDQPIDEPESGEAVEKQKLTANEEDEDDEEDEEEKDYSNLSKEELISEMEKILGGEDMKKIDKSVKELKSFYNDIYESERKASLEKFLEEGGAEVDFQYAGDALDNRFSALYNKFKTRRAEYYENLEKEKEVNLQKKREILEKLRGIVDGEETTTSIGTLKEIQKEWRSIGPVPGQYAKSLWANYNILIDRFYDNRSIYFELKELDRKKNLEAKLELCAKAEKLLNYENIRDAVKELNELHEEYKHIGPIPKDVQEEVWQRFKAASDAVYTKRKEYVSELKKDLFANLEKKNALVEEAKKFTEFDSDKISDWNEKTREILDIQKRWESIGGLPREHARDVNKAFWSNFKTFFNNKNKFFKKLDGQRDENLKKKEELVKKAEELKESADWENTANILKDLQKEWKNIGPVPEKVRNEVYTKFKSACDTFFERRRAHSKDIEADYRENLKKKEAVCDEIEKMIGEESPDPDRFRELQVEFDKIGYVPRNAIRKIKKRYDSVINRFLEKVDLSESEKSELKYTVEVNRLKSSPNSDRRIHRKESELRRMISKIENDIALWKNNLEFFAESKTADKLRDEFNEKIEKATDQLDELKEELKVLNKI